MATELIFNTLRVNPSTGQASAKFNYDSRADIPLRGSTATWVDDFDGDAIGGAGWYVDNVQMAVSIEVFNNMTITARQVGNGWCFANPATGAPLGILEERNFYSLIPWSKVVDGVVTIGYWNMFSNWPSGSDFTTLEPDPIKESLLTWEIEFVSTTNYSAWQHHINGTWPAGITPPVATAGIFWCRKVAIEIETERHPTTDAETIYYRHFMTFWQAPIVAATQMLWTKTAWT